MAGAQNVAKTPWGAQSARAKTAPKQHVKQTRWAKLFANNHDALIENSQITIIFPRYYQKTL